MRQINSCARLTSKKARTSKPPVGLDQEIELRFDDLLSNGQAVGRAEGMAIFVFGPLPNERATIRITAVKQNYAVGTVVRMLERSDARAEPFCPVFGACGGCQVQHLSYDQQLTWKQALVSNALQRIGGIATPDVKPTIGMPNPRAYRNKMALVVDRSNNGFGFYKQRSHDIVPIGHCPIVQPSLDRCIASLLDLRSDPQTTGAFADARHVVARTSRATGQNVVTITGSRPSETRRKLASTLFDRLPNTAGFSESFDLSSENAILGRKKRILAGSESIEEIVGGIRVKVSAGSFFQVNIEILECIFDAIRPLAAQAHRIFDLYCGSGAFALCFAKAGCHVLGIEENATAVDEARRNAALNELGARPEFRCGRVDEVLREPATAKALRAVDAVFLDPPRKGSDPRTLSAIAEAGVASVWYLSCDPATLARDLKFLLPKGYRLNSVQPFDMFPQTGHVESLALLSRIEK